MALDSRMVDLPFTSAGGVRVIPPLEPCACVRAYGSNHRTNRGPEMGRRCVLQLCICIDLVVRCHVLVVEGVRLAIETPQVSNRAARVFRIYGFQRDRRFRATRLGDRGNAGCRSPGNPDLSPQESRIELAAPRTGSATKQKAHDRAGTPNGPGKPDSVTSLPPRTGDGTYLRLLFCLRIVRWDGKVWFDSSSFQIRFL